MLETPERYAESCVRIERGASLPAIALAAAAAAFLAATGWSIARVEPDAAQAARASAAALAAARGDWIGVDGSHGGATLTVSGPRSRPSVRLCAPNCVELGADVAPAAARRLVARYAHDGAGGTGLAEILLAPERIEIRAAGGAVSGVHVFERR